MSVDVEVIAENLTELLTNSVNLSTVYYDLFINPTPMDIEIKLYNDENKLVSVVIPNRAKDRQISLAGNGSPESVVVGNIGACYVDTVSNDIWFKVSDSGKATGWAIAMTKDSIASTLGDYVKKSLKINGRDLKQDVVLTPNDIGALDKTTSYGAGLSASGSVLKLLDQEGSELDSVTFSAFGADINLSNLSEQGNAKFAPASLTSEVEKKQDKLVSLTKQEYEGLAVKDEDTYYVITDDSDLESSSDFFFVSLLELQYPVGSVYTTTNDTCPISAYVGTWENKGYIAVSGTRVNVFRRAS